jgi:hypothetical protein
VNAVGAETHGALVKERAKRLIANWMNGRSALSVSVREGLTPKQDRTATYEVVYEVAFEPSGPDQLRVELWFTAQGGLGIGVETRNRVADRLNLSNWRRGFAGGQELDSKGVETVIPVLDLAAGGHIAIEACVVPVLGLGATRAIAVLESLKEFPHLMQSTPRWLKRVQRFTDTTWRRVLRYRAW